MDDTKPRFFVAHDSGGLALWLSRKRPTMNQKSRIWKCPEGTRLRLPYSWFGHLLRENSCVEVDMETAVIAATDRW